jgi:hypothetical protein
MISAPENCIKQDKKEQSVNVKMFQTKDQGPGKKKTKTKKPRA